jgi:hypothetical protein
MVITLALLEMVLMRTPQFTFNDVIKSFARKEVLSKAELLQEYGCSPVTVWRLLRQVGYVASYNYNAKYYTLATIPRFDDHGLWAYQDVRFSKWGTLPETIVAVIERSSAGMTARELAELLHVRNVKPLLTQLILKQRLFREAVDRSFVYLAVQQSRHEQQLQRRLEQVPVRLLPEPQQIIALLVEMIRHPQQTPRQWARRLVRHNIRLGTQDIGAVIKHYHLAVKKGLLSS